MAATFVVAVILAVAAVAFVLVQQQQLEGALEKVAAQQAADVATQITQTGSAAVDLTGSGSGEQALVQVLTRDGEMLASSPSVVGEPPIVNDRPAPGEVATTQVVALAIGEGEPFVVVSRGVSTHEGDLVVTAAQSLETVGQATSVVIELLAVGYPVLLLMVAAMAYWLTGRALAPVEAIQRRVAGITATDLTARVPVPAADDEIKALADTMNAMLARLEAAGQAQLRFVADASHELRSPLASIRAAHEVAEIHPGVADWESINGDVLAELDRLDRLVADMLLLARVDEHGLGIQRHEVDLDDLVLDEARRLRQQTALQVEVSVTPVRVNGDRDHLARALRNLTDNAAHHARDHVQLRLATTETSAVIHVIDDGPGIPEPERERVFERFVRLDPSRQRPNGGAGLGLAIAREIARAHDGDVTLCTTMTGTHLMVTVPYQAGPDLRQAPSNAS